MDWYEKIISKGNIKVGGHIIKVIEVEPNSLSEDNTCGATDLDNNTITISAELPQSHKFATLLHEVIHIMNWKLSETDVEFLAQAFYQVISDNPL